MPKDYTYTYNTKSKILTGEFFDKYKLVAGIDVDRIYTELDAIYIINTFALACYRGRFTCLTPWSGKEICEYISDVSEQLNFRMAVEFSEEDED